MSSYNHFGCSCCGGPFNGGNCPSCILKRIESEQAANQAVQEEQEEPVAQSFLLNWNFPMADDDDRDISIASPKIDFLPEEFAGELNLIDLILPGIDEDDFDEEEGEIDIDILQIEEMMIPSHLSFGLYSRKLTTYPGGILLASLHKRSEDTNFGPRASPLKAIGISLDGNFHGTDNGQKDTIKPIKDKIRAREGKEREKPRPSKVNSLIHTLAHPFLLEDPDTAATYAKLAILRPPIG
ncbi:hypothetical protein Tco_1211328 [Tanacetum coccineum]